MALVSCPECNGIISDSAEKCPHCGYPFIKEMPQAVVKEKIVIRDGNWGCISTFIFLILAYALYSGVSALFSHLF